MLWQLAQFQFCDNKHLLWRDGVQCQLEPKQAEVLAYFCRHPGRLISRDELMAEVWQGQIVTENAINRIIAKLRKSLGDNAKQSEFIITLPRKGYRLIATVSPVDLSASPPALAATVSPPVAEPIHNRHGNHNLNSGWLVLVAVLLLSVIGWGSSWFDSWQPRQNEIQHSFTLTPLTRESGEELQPALAPDGQSLIYSAYQGRWLALYLKDLTSSEISLLSNEPGDSGNGDWSKEGLRFVYFYNNDQTCQIKLIEFQAHSQASATTEAELNKAVVSKKVLHHNVVHQCPVGSYGNVAFSHDGRKLIYSENNGRGTAYQIYLKNLSTGDIRKPAQPPLFLAGNAEFDLHPSLDQLLIASPDEAQQLAYYLLDLPGNQLRHLFTKNNWLCCPIWDHQGETVLQTDATPANQLLQFGLDGQQLASLFSASHNMSKLRRAGDGQSYVYSGWHGSRQIRYQALTGEAVTTVIASSVSDSLPTISNQQQYLAFVSERSGSREIWLHQTDNSQNRKLTEFKRNDWIYDLQWSPDDRQLAVLFINEIQLLDIDSGQRRTLAIPAQEIRGLSWTNEDTLAFSLQKSPQQSEAHHNQNEPNNLQWQLYHYQIAASQLLQQSGDWAYALYDAGSQQVIRINQQQQLFLADQQLSLQLPAIIDRNRRFYFSFLQGKLYFLQQKPDSVGNATVLMQYDTATALLQILAEFPAQTMFSLGKNGIYFTEDQPPEADIYRLNR